MLRLPRPKSADRSARPRSAGGDPTDGLCGRRVGASPPRADTGGARLVFSIAAQVDMATWARDRVILVGDAAYCTSPMSGQGSSLAILAAHVLAAELAAAGGDHAAACGEYDREMRPFIAVNQAHGIQSAQFMTQDPATAPVELSRREIEAGINHSTARIAETANAITLKNYLAIIPKPTG